MIMDSIFFISYRALGQKIRYSPAAADRSSYFSYCIAANQPPRPARLGLARALVNDKVSETL